MHACSPDAPLLMHCFQHVPVELAACQQITPWRVKSRSSHSWPPAAGWHLASSDAGTSLSHTLVWPSRPVRDLSSSLPATGHLVRVLRAAGAGDRAAGLLPVQPRGSAAGEEVERGRAHAARPHGRRQLRAGVRGHHQPTRQGLAAKCCCLRSSYRRNCMGSGSIGQVCMSMGPLPAGQSCSIIHETH